MFDDKRTVDDGKREPPKKRARVCKEVSLEQQIFSWKSVAVPCYTYKGIKMKTKILNFPKNKDIVMAKWMQDKSKVIFYFTDGSYRTFGMKLTLVDNDA